MMTRMPVVLCLLGALSLGQTSEAVAQQALLEEVKALRAAVAKLEKSQNALVALVRIGIDESRIASLETEHRQLIAEEQRLDSEVRQAAAALRLENPGSLPTLAPVAPGAAPQIVHSSESSDARLRHAEASRRLEEVRRKRQTAEQSITRLRDRIAAWEKYLAELLR